MADGSLSRRELLRRGGEAGALLALPVVGRADAASRRYVHLDELAEAIGARLATLTQAEWGLVTSGCSAGLTHATAACVAGGNPELHVRIPNLQGFAKDEVIIPSHSRNVYDAAIRAVGVRVVTVATVAELEAAIGPRTALIYVLAGPDDNAANKNVGWVDARWDGACAATVGYLREHWRYPCVDWWEEREGVHAATVGSIWAATRDA